MRQTIDNFVEQQTQQRRADWSQFRSAARKILNQHGFGGLRASRSLGDFLALN